MHSTIFTDVLVLLFLLSRGECAPPRSPGEDPDPVTDMRYVLACNATSPVSLSAVNEVLVHKRLGEGEHRSFQCFLHCLFTKYGWMDADGGFLREEMGRVLHESLPEEPDLVRALLHECTDIPDRDKCTRALLFTKCFWERLDHPELDMDSNHLYYEHWP